MENESSTILLTFLNILADELQIEELGSLDEAPNLVPILLQLVKTGELTFVFNPLDEKFSNAVEYIKNTLGNNFVEQLNAENADKGDKVEIAKMMLALVYALRLLQEQKFSQLSDRLGVLENHQMADIISILDSYDRFSPLPFSEVLNSAHLSTSVPTVIRTSLTPKSTENNKENNLPINHINNLSSAGRKKTICNLQTSKIPTSSSRKQSSFRLKTPSTIIKERNYLLALEGSPVNKVLNSPRGEEVVRIHALNEELKSLKEFWDQVGQEKDRLDDLCRAKDSEINLLKEDNENKRSKIARLLLQNERISSMEDYILKLEEDKSKFEKIIREEKNKLASLEVRLAEVKFERDETLHKFELNQSDLEHLKGEYDKTLKREKNMAEILNQKCTKFAEFERAYGNEINALKSRLREMEGAIEEERIASIFRVEQKDEQMQDQMKMMQQIKEHSEEQAEQLKRKYIMEQELLKQKNQQLSVDYDILLTRSNQGVAESKYPEHPLYEFSSCETSCEMKIDVSAMIDNNREVYSPSNESTNAPKSLCDAGTSPFSDSMVKRLCKSTTQLDIMGNKKTRRQLQLDELFNSERKPKNDDFFDILGRMQAERIEDQRAEFPLSIQIDSRSMNIDFANSSNSSSNRVLFKRGIGTLKRSTIKSLSNMKSAMTSSSSKIRHRLNRKESKAQFLEHKDESGTIDGETSEHDISIDSSAKNSNTSRITK